MHIKGQGLLTSGDNLLDNKVNLNMIQGKLANLGLYSIWWVTSEKLVLRCTIPFLTGRRTFTGKTVNRNIIFFYLYFAA